MNERFQAAVNHGLMQFGLSFEVLGPNTCQVYELLYA